MSKLPLQVFPFAAAVAVLLLPGCSETNSPPADGGAPVKNQGVVAEEKAPPRAEFQEVEDVVEPVVESETTPAEEAVEEVETDTVESAFDSNQWNTAVGLGGGAGGRFGSRARVPLKKSFTAESYSKVVENPFKSAGLEPISTFGVDVDTASYTNVRRFLNYGQLPPASAVRVEEMINYFRYDYPAPANRDSFSVTLERGVCPWNTDHQLVLVGLQGQTIDPRKAPPRNLVFLIDVSGSMRSADKLPLVQRSLSALVMGLTDKDSVAIVMYAGRESVALEPTRCAGRVEKLAIRTCIENLRNGGGTNGAGGIQKAYELARTSFHKEHVNRVILVTDGDFNVGVSGTAELTKMIEKERESGVYLTVVGVGTGNLRDDMMSSIAKHGNGQYIYLDSEAEARRKFVKGLTGTLVTIAKDVKLQVEFNPRKVAGYRLIGYERRVMKTEDFRDDKKDSGEIGAGHSVTALYEVVPAGRAVPGVAADAKAADASLAKGGDEMMEVRLRYKAPWAQKAKESSVKLGKAATHGTNIDFASAVAMFGMVLSKSQHSGGASLELVSELAIRALENDQDDLRKEFVGLVKKADDTIRAVAAEEARKKIVLLRQAQRKELRSAETEHGKVKSPGIRKGLDWLAARQQSDGSFQDTVEGPVHDVGLTGLATLAFLGDGSTLRAGPFKDNVKRAVKWLRNKQNGDGLYTTKASEGSLLDHVIAAYAMTEAHGLSNYQLLKRNVVAGRDYLTDLQVKGTVQTLGWQILLQESLTEFRVSKGAEELRAAASKILKRPAEKGNRTQARASITLLERFLLRGKALAKNEPSPPQGDQIFALDPTKLEETDAASFFFGARALCEIGGRHLKTWRDKKCADILTSQKKDGTFGGKSRVYDTALMVLSLEEPARHLRTWR